MGRNDDSKGLKTRRRGRGYGPPAASQSHGKPT